MCITSPSEELPSHFQSQHQLSCMQKHGCTCPAPAPTSPCPVIYPTVELFKGVTHLAGSQLRGRHSLLLTTPVLCWAGRAQHQDLALGNMGHLWDNPLQACSLLCQSRGLWGHPQEAPWVPFGAASHREHQYGNGMGIPELGPRRGTMGWDWTRVPHITQVGLLWCWIPGQAPMSLNSF